MTYNILAGGGTLLPDERYIGNRLPLILSIIKSVNPDILGIQEAHLWQLRNDAIAREVATDSGQLLQVFIVHLRQHEEFEFLLSEIEPYFLDQTILMGDMNFPTWDERARKLKDAGWLLAQSGQYSNYSSIDQIWVSPPLQFEWMNMRISFDRLTDASDHHPVYVKINIYEP
jgi:endonuclease/exonuclease/phosphatase family metal-dependent hydrolase